MSNDKIIVVLYKHSSNEKIDVEVPLDITANELIISLNEGFALGMDTSDISKCFLRTENPIALLKGNRTLAEYELRNGTIINYI